MPASEQRFECGVRRGRELTDGLSLANRIDLRDAMQPLAELSTRWALADLRAKLANGTPVYLFGRRITSV